MEKMVYKGYVIEEYWIPIFSKYCFYLENECEASLGFGDSIEYCKINIDILLEDSDESSSDYAKRLYAFSLDWVKSKMKPFTMEDLKNDWIKAGNKPPLQPSVYGAPFKKLSKDKIIFDTGRTIRSTCPKAHGRALRVWISLQFRLKQQSNRVKDKTESQIPLF